MSENADILIVGSGLMGAAVAQRIRAANPRCRIIMVDGGQPIGALPGQHLHDTRDLDLRRQYIRSASPGLQSMYVGEGRTARVDGNLAHIRPGMHSLSAFHADADQFPASAQAWNVGGMGVHWTAATPTPWGREVFALTGEQRWKEELEVAKDLLAVDPDPFPPSLAASMILDCISATVAGRTAAGREPQTMPMAVKRQLDGPMPRTGPNRIFPRMNEVSGPDFELLSGKLAFKIEYQGRQASAVQVRDVVSGLETTIEARFVVVAADPIRTPQLLFASGIRPQALGHYLNEHAYLAGRVLVDLNRLGIPLETVPLPQASEWMVAAQWLPHSDQDQPYHGIFLSRLFFDENGRRLAYATTLSLYIPTTIRRENRVEFDHQRCDAVGLPLPHFHFRYSPEDLSLFEGARALQAKLGQRLGQFDPLRDSVLLEPGSSLHFTGTARSGVKDDGSTVCNPSGRVWGFDNLFLAGGAVVPTEVVGNSTLAAMVTAVRAASAISASL